MEQLKQVLLLHQEGQSIKAIVRLTGLSRNIVRTYLHRHETATGDSIPQTDTQLAATLYNSANDGTKIIKNCTFHLTSCCFLN